MSDGIENIIDEIKYNASMEDANKFVMDMILPALMGKEDSLMSDYNTDQIHDPYFSALGILFAVNLAKGWTKEELLKFLLFVEAPITADDQDKEEDD